MNIIYEMIKNVLKNSKELKNLSEKEKEKIYEDKYNQILNVKLIEK